MKEILIAIVLLVVGFVLLIKGADFFVEGSSSVAKRLRVPSIIIGLTIVAMGTSLPELAVSVTASMSGNNALAVSNAVGSNIFNLMVVVGVCSILTPILVQKETIRRDIPFSMICALLLLGLGILAAGDTIGMRLGHLRHPALRVWLYWNDAWTCGRYHFLCPVCRIPCLYDSQRIKGARGRRENP